MNEKITCAVCKNEVDRKCTVKKNVGVAINKRRNCNKFVLESTKVKEKQILKTIKLSYAEREALRKEFKQEIKRHKDNIKNDTMPDPKHPITGDLSRFTSTAGDR